MLFLRYMLNRTSNAHCKLRVARWLLCLRQCTPQNSSVHSSYRTIRKLFKHALITPFLSAYRMSSFTFLRTSIIITFAYHSGTVVVRQKLIITLLCTMFLFLLKTSFHQVHSGHFIVSLRITSRFNCLFTTTQTLHELQLNVHVFSFFFFTHGQITQLIGPPSLF